MGILLCVCVFYYCSLFTNSPSSFPLSTAGLGLLINFLGLVLFGGHGHSHGGGGDHGHAHGGGGAAEEEVGRLWKEEDAERRVVCCVILNVSVVS